jgi:hypothetical protein
MKMVNLWLLFLVTSLQGFGNNIDFLKGDAYFASSWNTILFSNPPEGIMLRYSRLTHMSMDCGNLGVEAIIIQNIPEPYRKNLKLVDQLLAKTGKDVEKVPRRLLIYNKDYDFEKWGIGYKYNEDWVEQQTGSDDRRHAKYDLLGDSSRVIKDWQFAVNVNPLKGSVVKVDDNMNEELYEILLAEEDEPIESSKPENDAQNPYDESPFSSKSLPKEVLVGNGNDFALVVMLSASLDQMMLNTYSELRAKFDLDDSSITNEERQKIPKEIKLLPVELMKFYVIDEKIRLFEEQKNGDWKVTEQGIKK